MTPQPFLPHEHTEAAAYLRGPVLVGLAWVCLDNWLKTFRIRWLLAAGRYLVAAVRMAVEQGGKR